MFSFVCFFLRLFSDYHLSTMFHANDSSVIWWQRIHEIYAIKVCSISKRQFILAYYIMQTYAWSFFFGLVDFVPFASNLVERHYVSEDLNLSIAGFLVHSEHTTKLKYRFYILRIARFKTKISFSNKSLLLFYYLSWKFWKNYNNS